MLAYRRETVPDDVLTAIHRCHEGAFTDADAIDHTPLDRYFRHNKRGVMDVSRDALVDALCRACDAWGLEALVKSKAGYRKPHLMHRELRRFRVLYEGNPFQVETFVKNVMHLPVEDEMVAGQTKRSVVGVYSCHARLFELLKMAPLRVRELHLELLLLRLHRLGEIPARIPRHACRRARSDESSVSGRGRHLERDVVEKFQYARVRLSSCTRLARHRTRDR